MLKVKEIPPEIGYYLAGFADGEGSFNVSFRFRADYKIPWKISLCFNISQRDLVTLATFKRYLKCGTMRRRKDGVWYYEVNNLDSILENVILFLSALVFGLLRRREVFQSLRKFPGLSLRKDT